MNDATEMTGIIRGYHAAREAMRDIAAMVTAGDWGRAEPWGGAGVVVTDVPADVTGNGWSDPLVAATGHVAELSWLFERARDAVQGLEGYGQWKEEFFGRMAEAVIAAGPDASARTHLGVAVWAGELTLGHIAERAFR